MPIIILIVSFLCALFLTPLIKWSAIRFGIVDAPDHRKIHKHPIPLMGGVAVGISFIVGIIFGNLQALIFPLILLTLLFLAFGALDDGGYKMHARIKIIVHLIFSGIFVLGFGIHLSIFQDLWVNNLLTICFITFMTNSTNMLDGMDGLVSGIAIIAAGFFALIAVSVGQIEVVIISLALMGGALGFLKYNFNPASIFLGEGGSTFIGFILAFLAIKLDFGALCNIPIGNISISLQLVDFIVLLVLLGIPIFDTYFVFTNRFLHKIKFNQPGIDHSHHRIHLMGFSQRATVMTLYAVQIILGFLALALTRADLIQYLALLGIVAMFFVGFTILLLQVKVYES